MASEVGICNRALQKLGARRITSMTEDSVNARACNAAYEAVRDAMYRAHTWVFTTARASLAADSTAPDWGRQNSFTLPSDFIRLLDDYPERNTTDVDFEIEQNKILTNFDAPLEIRYVSRVTDPNIMDPLFREAFSTALAFELCEEITQSNTKKASLKEDLKDIIRDAKRVNASVRSIT